MSLLAVSLLGLTATPMIAQQNATDKKQKPDTVHVTVIQIPEREMDKLNDELAYKDAVQALKTQQFVLEADQIIFKNGINRYVSPITNFVMMSKDKSTVQVAFNNGFAGPNGVGGVTVDGSTSNVEMKMDKKGNATYAFNTLGTGLSAQIYITLYEGGNDARVTISPDFNSNTFTLRGRLVPLDQSGIFKGTVSY